MGPDMPRNSKHCTTSGPKTAFMTKLCEQDHPNTLSATRAEKTNTVRGPPKSTESSYGVPYSLVHVGRSAFSKIRVLCSGIVGAISHALASSMCDRAHVALRSQMSGNAKAMQVPRHRAAWRANECALMCVRPSSSAQVYTTYLGGLDLIWSRVDEFCYGARND